MKPASLGRLSTFINAAVHPRDQPQVCRRRPGARCNNNRLMIPLHRPPFGIGTVMASMLPGGGRRSLQRLEESYAEASGCAAAVWLPSARGGICWALCAAIGIQTTVIGPAFTCAAVHEAMVRSGGNVRLLEPGESD